MNKRDRELAVSVFKVVRASDRMPTPWVGTREHKVNPNTVEALERRGWAETRWSEKQRRILCRPTPAGRLFLAEAEALESARVGDEPLADAL